nr:MAG TPA: hypothetical protein [Caudoviricetes sp.]
MKQVKINEIKGAIALTKEYVVKLENYKFYIQKLIALKNGVNLLNTDEYYKEMIFNEAFALINTKLSESRSSQYSMLIDGYIYINETKLMNVLNIDKVSDIFNLNTRDFKAIDQAVDILIDLYLYRKNSLKFKCMEIVEHIYGMYKLFSLREDIDEHMTKYALINIIDFLMAPANSFEDHIDRNIISQAYIDNCKDTTTVEEINIIEDMYKYIPELFDYYFGGIDAFLSIRDMRKTGDQNEN